MPCDTNAERTSMEVAAAEDRNMVAEPGAEFLAVLLCNRGRLAPRTSGDPAETSWEVASIRSPGAARRRRR